MNCSVHSTCHHILDASPSESDLHLFFAHKNTVTACCSLGDDFSVNIAVFNVYDITVISLS